MKRLFGISLLTVLLWSCGDNGATYKPGSQGAAYEVVVVCTNAAWEGPVGDTLRSFMLSPVDLINRREPEFDLLRVAPSGFADLVQKHRNIFILNIGEKFEDTSLNIYTDVYASPQLVIQLDAPTPQAMTAALDTSRTRIMQYLETAERLRDSEAALHHGAKNIDKQIAEKFGFSINIPAGYTVRNSQDDFMWISYEMPTASQGIVIYTYPYTGKEDFTAENLLARRNEFVKRIPGPSDGSYMTTAEPAVCDYRRIGDRPWAELRGYWDVEGDFMGGPFASYSTLDNSSGRVVCLDFYVFSPQLPQRNYLRALQHIVYSFSPEAVQ